MTVGRDVVAGAVVCRGDGRRQSMGHTKCLALIRRIPLRRVPSLNGIGCVTCQVRLTACLIGADAKISRELLLNLLRQPRDLAGVHEGEPSRRNPAPPMAERRGSVHLRRRQIEWLRPFERCVRTLMPGRKRPKA